MSQITIRDLDQSVEELIRQHAASKGISMSKAISDILAKAFGVNRGEGRYRDLSEYTGTWTAEETVEFEKSQESFNCIDEDLWK
ncbi:hypothetical protein MASR2M78_30190 [Treponema sp.]